MIVNNKAIYIMADSGCMNTARNSLDSIAAGYENGASGCCFNFDITKDGIPVLGENGKVPASDGSITLLSNFSFDEMRPFCKSLVTAGQAIDLAKSYSNKIAFKASNIKMLPSIRISLKYSEYLNDSYMLCDTKKESLELIRKYPDVHFVLSVPHLSDNVNELLIFVKDAGFFGIEIDPKDADSSFVIKAQRLGLFVASSSTDDEVYLKRMVEMNVNFITTSRPDLASSFVSLR